MPKEMQQLLEMALCDPVLRKRLINTKLSSAPYTDFCHVAGEYGIALTEDTLLGSGDELTSNLLKSSNGGATFPFEYLDDLYELFLAALQ